MDLVVDPNRASPADWSGGPHVPDRLVGRGSGVDETSFTQDLDRIIIMPIPDDQTEPISTDCTR